MVDVGGGSTELILGDFRTSLDVGSTRLTERFLHTRPAAADELEPRAAHVAGLLPPLDVTPRSASPALSPSSNSSPARSRRRAVEAQLARLASLPVAERRTCRASTPRARR